MDACKRVEVDWVDSETSKGWFYRDGLESPDLHVTSIGLLCYEDDTCMGLTTSVALGVGKEAVLDPIWIPKCAILEIRRDLLPESVRESG